MLRRRENARTRDLNASALPGAWFLSGCSYHVEFVKTMVVDEFSKRCGYRMISLFLFLRTMAAAALYARFIDSGVQAVMRSSRVLSTRQGKMSSVPDTSAPAGHS